MNEYVIINKTVIQKRIEELECKLSNEKESEEPLLYLLGEFQGEIKCLKQILSQSTPLTPVLRKTWNNAYVDALSMDEETYKPLFFEDYVLNLKLDI